MDIRDVKTLDDFFVFVMADEAEYMRDLGALDLKDYEFVGMDPTKLMMVLLSKAGDASTLRRDMTTIIALSQMRGTAIRKMMARMSNAGKAKLTVIVNRYQIQPHAKSVPMEQPTLPRIVALFPKIVYDYRVAHPSKVRTLGVIPAGFPAALCFPGGCAMIKMANANYTDLFVQWFITFADIVGIKNKDRATILIPQQFSKVPETQRF